MPSATFSTPIDDRYFDDYVAGSVFEFGPASLSEEEIITFARQYDPQMIHTDPVRAASGPFKGLIASGWQTAGVMMRLYIDHFLTHNASQASPGVDVRWTVPVRPGDELRLRITILEANVSKSKPDRGTLVSQLEALNQKDEVVCTMKAVNLVGRRPSPVASP